MPYALPPPAMPYGVVPYMQPYAQYPSPYAQPYAMPPYYAPPYAPPAYAPSPYASHPGVPQMPLHKPPESMHARPQSAPAPTHFSQQLLSVARVDMYGLPVVAGDPTVTFPQVFRLEEKLLGAIRGAFHARDQQGTLRYKVDSRLASLHERKVLKDVNGQVLLKLREERLTVRDRITFFSPTNIPMLTLQKTTAVQFGTKRVHGFAGPDTSGTPALIITGDADSTHFRIFNAQNKEVCNIRRQKHTLKNWLTDQDSYDVTVNYGSPALMCFIAVALDEIYED
ncbi:LURP-one-related protein [Gracilaria domingensis]|nr:LURP-one-related protein [Gracilaria domingensis]